MIKIVGVPHVDWKSLGIDKVTGAQALIRFCPPSLNPRLRHFNISLITQEVDVSALRATPTVVSSLGPFQFLLTSNLLEWHNTVIYLSSLEGHNRKLSNDIIEEFERVGLASLWQGYRRQRYGDSTYSLELN